MYIYYLLPNFCKYRRKLSLFLNFSSKKFWCSDIFAYLCTRFPKQSGLVSAKERVLWKDYINREVVQEASTEMYLGKETNRSIWSGLNSINYKDGHSENRQTINLNVENNDILQWRVRSWLRMNASYRLNTCKWRGNGKKACFLGRRPANGWVTRIQPAPK